VFSEIRTSRLILRDLEPNDGPRIFSYHRHPEVARFQTWGTESVDVIQSYIRGLPESDPDTPGRWYQVGIYLPSGKLIGDCGVRTVEAEPRQAEIGITLAPEFQRQGYATEALQGLLNYLFTALEKHRIFGSLDPRNTASINLLKRVGMRQEAHFVQSLWFRGEWVDDLIFALLASEWKTLEGNSHQGGFERDRL